MENGWAKNMQEERLDCDGVVDVGLIVISHWENPAKYTALDFLRKVLLREVKAVIPNSAFIGAYHVMTSYLNLSRPEAAGALSKTLSLNTPAFYENILKEDILEGFNYCLSYSIESWDAYLLSLGRRLGTRTVFSIDNKLKTKANDFNIVNPIPEETMKKYHTFVSKL